MKVNNRQNLRRILQSWLRLTPSQKSLMGTPNQVAAMDEMAGLLLKALGKGPSSQLKTALYSLFDLQPDFEPIAWIGDQAVAYMSTSGQVLQQGVEYSEPELFLPPKSLK